MIRYSPLLETTEFRIGRFDHPQGQFHCDPRLEVATEHSVNRVESGEFVVEIGRQHWELRPGSLFLTYPGMEYRCRHHEVAPTDVCVAIDIPAKGAEETAAFERVARK